MNCSTGTVPGDSCLGREWANLPQHDRIHSLSPLPRFSRGCATRVGRAPSCTAATAPNGYVSHPPSALTGSAPRCRSAVDCRLRPARVPRSCVLGSSTNPCARRCCRRQRFTERSLVEVRRRGWAQSVGQREAGVASVSAPVRDGTGDVVAALSISGPIERLGRSPGARYSPILVDGARRINEAMEG